MIIFISGIDGAGKTTHAKKLALELSAFGIKTKYLWMRGRGRVFFSLPLLAIARFLGFTEIRKLPDGKMFSLYNFYLNTAFARVWLLAQFLDAMLFTFILYILQDVLKYTLVIDRSAIDTIVDLKLDVTGDVFGHKVETLFKNLLFKNSVVILLDAKEKVIRQRKNDFPDLDYLILRRGLYATLSKKYDWKVISSGDVFSYVHDQILKTIIPYFKLNKK